MDRAQPGRLTAGLTRFALAGDQVADYRARVSHPRWPPSWPCGRAPATWRRRWRRISAPLSPLPVTISVRLAA